MLALNVSSDVLNGFSLVDESLSRTTVNLSLIHIFFYIIPFMTETRERTVCRLPELKARHLPGDCREAVYTLLKATYEMCIRDRVLIRNILY